MKTRILLYIAVLIFPFLNSCEENDDIIQPELVGEHWIDYVKMQFTPVTEGETHFIYNKVLGDTPDEYWSTTELDFDVTLDPGSASLSDISKIDIYVFAEEKHGDTYKYLGGAQGKLFTTITDPNEMFQITISKTQLEDIFQTEFSADHNGEILLEDLFEFKWAITGKDGTVYDTRTDCFGFDCTHAVSSRVVEVAPPIWEGTFNYEWTAATANAQSYGNISVGQTGTMTFSLKPGYYTVYDVSHLTADYYYGSGGTLDYNYDSGLVEITGRYDQKWDIVKVEGATLTIDFSYQYSVGYDEYGTFTLTRTDGEDWPANIHTN